jgi:tRNA (cytidine56-2'-O)-methyltransferase
VKVEVLRIGHRPGRDPRLTTHLALTARAFGAKAIHIQPPDSTLQSSIEGVVKRFGGDFSVKGVGNWKPIVKSWEGTSIHLTMYGEDLDDVIGDIPKTQPILLIVGGPKVPSEVYQLATRNVAVTHQPHSEVAALAITLDRLLGTPRVEKLPGASVQVLPCPRGKKVVELSG